MDQLSEQYNQTNRVPLRLSHPLLIHISASKMRRYCKRIAHICHSSRSRHVRIHSNTEKNILVVGALGQSLAEVDVMVFWPLLRLVRANNQTSLLKLTRCDVMSINNDIVTNIHSGG